MHVRVYRWATHGKTGPNGAPGSETRREDSFCSANVSFHSRGLENKRLFQNKWGLSAPAMERAAKRLLGGKGHANIGLIPLSSRCLQRCSGNIPTSCAARHCKAQAAAWGLLLTHGVSWVTLSGSPRPALGECLSSSGGFHPPLRTCAPFAVGYGAFGCPRTKWKGTGKMQPELFNSVQKDGERQQQELEQGKFPVNARTNHEATVMMLKYWNRDLEMGIAVLGDTQALTGAAWEQPAQSWARWEQRPS